VHDTTPARGPDIFVAPPVQRPLRPIRPPIIACVAEARSTIPHRSGTCPRGHVRSTKPGIRKCPTANSNPPVSSLEKRTSANSTPNARPRHSRRDRRTHSQTRPRTNGSKTPYVSLPIKSNAMNQGAVLMQGMCPGHGRTDSRAADGRRSLAGPQTGLNRLNLLLPWPQWQRGRHPSDKPVTNKARQRRWHAS